MIRYDTNDRMRVILQCFYFLLEAIKLRVRGVASNFKETKLCMNKTYFIPNAKYSCLLFKCNCMLSGVNFLMVVTYKNGITTPLIMTFTYVSLSKTCNRGAIIGFSGSHVEEDTAKLHRKKERNGEAIKPSSI